jgi:predicted dehydrogenase/SAM-dependent methyltransferase
MAESGEADTVDLQAKKRALPEVVLVGYGHAGRIHAKAYGDLQDICRLVAVVESDPGRFRQIEQALPGTRACRDLAEALKGLRPGFIVDFCVPAKANLKLAKTAIRHGARKLVIEKPLGWDVASTERLVADLSAYEVVYLDTYAASAGVSELLRHIRDRDSAVRQVQVRFHKNRKEDSRAGRGFDRDAVPSAWMIEGPHMLSIARLIAGEIAGVASAATFDMEIEDGHVLPDHGGGQATLEHQGGAVSHLELSLCAERNQRRVEVLLADGTRLALELPPSKAIEQVSVLEVQRPGGAAGVHRLADRPMELCVQNAIRHLLGGAANVSRLADGLAVCAAVEKMTEKTKFWQSVPGKWKYFGPPLRPCPEDIGIMEMQVARWTQAAGATRCEALLCGVTPEIADMNWPAETRLWAVERSRAMIEEVWPARGSSSKLPLEAEWTRLPFAPSSFDIVVGDGCLTSLAYPERQQLFLESLRTVLRPGGRLIMRFFVQPDRAESPDAVLQDLREGRIGSFHVFKWRLAMSLQNGAAKGVRVDRVWREWRKAGISTPWPLETVQTIDAYRGSEHRLTFTTMDQIRGLHAPYFRELACVVPSYELGERCPILVYAPR